LRTDGTAAPVFFLHGDLAGGGHYCDEVARCVDARHPFYVIDPHGTNGEPLPDSIETIARDNVAELRALVPRGPVILGGFCNGGIVAYEMARQLAAAGIPVQNLTIIDGISSNLGIPPAVTARRRFRHTLYRVCAAYGSHSGDRCSANWADWHDDLVARWRMSLERYIPGRYTGDISLLWTEECAAQSRTATENWRTIAPAVSADRVPGSHLTAITRHLRQTSSVLARHLTR
jgi:thioesterase domain-containing protein